MATLISFLTNSISPSADLHRQFKLNRARDFSIGAHTSTKFSSCLVSEKSQEKSSVSSSSKRSKEIMEMEAKYLVGTYARAPVAIERGNGCKLYDVDGKEYLDMTAGIAVNSLGHCDPDVVKELVDQGNTLWHVSNVYYSLPQVSSMARFPLHVNCLMKCCIYVCLADLVCNKGHKVGYCSENDLCSCMPIVW